MEFCQNNDRSLLEIDTNEKYIYFRLIKSKNQSLVQITEYNRDISYAWFIQASMSNIQGLFKDFSKPSYSFQGLKVYENPTLSVKILLQKCLTVILEKLVLEN